MPKISAFEGFLTASLIWVLFIGMNYGFYFFLIKEGNYIGPSAIYGFPVLYALIYVFIVFIMYELITRKDAFQSVMYPLFGYFYLDTIVQVHTNSVIYSNFITIIKNVAFNPDSIIVFLIFCFLLNFHAYKLSAIDEFLKSKKINVDYTFHFNIKILIILFIAFTPIYYFIIIYTGSPLSLFFPTIIYLASKNREKKIS